jgi:tetratricopeptide (TPR) repeat protein
MRPCGTSKKAVELRPEDGFIRDSLGWAYFKLKRYDEAISNLEKAVQLTENDPTILEHLADVYAAKGDSSRAKLLYQRVLKIDPENKTAASKLKRLRNIKGVQ